MYDTSPSVIEEYTVLRGKHFQVKYSLSFVANFDFDF